MERPGNKYWMQKDRKQIGTHQMGRDHLENTLAMLMRKVMTDDTTFNGELLDVHRQHPNFGRGQSISDQKRAIKLQRMREWIAHLQAEIEWRDHDMTAALDKPGARRAGSRFPNWKPE